MNSKLLDELFEFLRIPSISSGGGDPGDLARAAAWVCDKIRAAGGSADIVETGGNPLAVGRLEAGEPDAPEVLIYGHYDVQSADPVDAWTSPPFEPTIRDGRLYARGACDDKGNFYPLLYVACELASHGRLPVNVTVAVEGEEEIGSSSIADWIDGYDAPVDCAVIFDSTMLDAQTPALTLGVRGIVMMEVRVRTGRRDVHSGLYGGPALNAVHCLHDMLSAVLPDPDGRLRAELRQGIVEPAPDELATWTSLPAGNDVLAEIGARAVSEDAADDYYRRVWSDASLDVHGVAGGDATQIRTIVPVVAQARLSLRLAPGQDAGVVGPELKRLLEQAAHPRADAHVAIVSAAQPALFDPNAAPLKLAVKALERVCGRPPALIRVGGSLPILSALARRGIPTICTGFALAEDAFHAPNESFRLASIEFCEATARELFAALGERSD